MERQELSGQVVERDVSAVRRPEAERFYVVRDVFRFGELEFAKPSDFSSRRIVLLIIRGPGAKHWRLREYLDMLMSWAGGRKASAKGEKQLWVAFQANFSSD